MYFYSLENNKKVLSSFDYTTEEALSAVNHQKWLKEEAIKLGYNPVSAFLVKVK